MCANARGHARACVQMRAGTRACVCKRQLYQRQMTRLEPLTLAKNVTVNFDNVTVCQVNQKPKCDNETLKHYEML
jgi:hypothetical protein